MLDYLQYQVLKVISPGGVAERCTGAAYDGKSKLEILLGRELLRTAIGKTVVDFGCGEGNESIELAKLGARKVIGIDIRDELLETARARAAAAGVSHICEFGRSADQRADLIISIDSFEHFDKPGQILNLMDGLLKPRGEVLVSFGPPWYHPLGGHLFSVFPWAHLLFSEKALIRWRSDFKSDGAMRFCEVAGGLNQMTIRGFERILEKSPFRAVRIEFVPIRRLARISNRWTREFTTSVVRCRIVRRAEWVSEMVMQGQGNAA
jgi:SAM-dependent methyltransferase